MADEAKPAPGIQDLSFLIALGLGFALIVIFAKLNPDLGKTEEINAIASEALKISSVYVDPGYEHRTYAIIENTADTPIPLSGWHIESTTGELDIATQNDPRSGRIEKDGKVILFIGNGGESASGVARLINPEGEVVDTYEF